MWFEDKRLVISCYTNFVVNPVYAEGKKDSFADVTTVFSSLIGATLQEVQYIGTTICYFEFSNLYMAATEYYDIEIQLTDKIYNPLEYAALPRKEGKHMEFLKRKDGD